MTIADSRKASKIDTFGVLDFGAVFECINSAGLSEICMKIVPIINENKKEYNAVGLSKGEHLYLNSNDAVIKLNAQLNI